MKKLALLFIYLFAGIIAFAQNEIDSLVKIGVQLHDEQKYDEAIAIYQKALEIDKEDPLANYEIALTYMYKKEYEKALKYSSVSLLYLNNYYLPSVIIKGSCLDYLGRTDESIALFKDAIKLHPDSYLLHYNLGYNLYHIGKKQEAQGTFIEAIKCNPYHSSSNLFLGIMMDEKNKKTQSILSLYYTLLCDPNSDRARTEVYPMLMEKLSSNVKQDKKNPKNITISVNEPDSSNNFSAAELMIAMLEASKYTKKNKKKSEFEHFMKTTSSLFSILGELKKKKDNGFWWEFYVPFFYTMKKDKQIETFCHLISASNKKESLQWIRKNKAKMEEFYQWMEKNPPVFPK